MTIISNTPPPEALAAINAGVSRVLRYAQIYQADGETLWVPSNQETRSRLIGGQVSLDYSRDDRRNFDAELDNSDGMLDIAGSEGFWYNKIIKIFRGVRYPIEPVAPTYETTDEWATQIGEFMIDKLGESSSAQRLKISGRDYVKKCQLSKFERSMTFKAGTFIYDLIKALASNAGIRKIKIPYTTEALATPLDVERGTDRWSIMKQAANSFNYDLYFDNEGYLTMTKYADPAIDAPIATFSHGKGGNMVSYDKSADDSRLFNHIVITGDRESVEGGNIVLPYHGEAVNTDPMSPTNVDEIGHRHYFYSSSFFTSDQQCRELAQSWLKVYTLESYDLNWTAINYPWLDVGKVVEVFEPGTENTSEKFLLDTLTFPLTLEPMSATGKRVLAIG